jgi:putative heme transporter
MRRLLRRYGSVLVGVAVVAAVFGFVLPRIASYRDVLAVIGSLSWGDIALLTAATVLNVATFAPPWMAALPGLGFRRALVVTQASTAAASVFPGGEAVGMGFTFAMLSAWGFRRSAVIATVAVLSTFNVLAKVLLPAAALVGLLLTGRENFLLAVLTVAGSVLIGALLGATITALRSEPSTRALGERLDRWRRRLPLLRRWDPEVGLPERLAGFRGAALTLLRRSWVWLTVWTLVGHLSVFLVLLVALRALGVPGGDVAVVEAFAVWALTRLLTAVPVTPGGLGIVELGLTGGLVAAGGDNDNVVAAVLLYRLLTWLPPIVLGVPAALLWKRLHPVTPVAPELP